jgi:ABC-type uncharacterized transport system substrate-binding protein
MSQRELYTVITQEKLAQDRRINDLQALKRQQKLEHRAVRKVMHTSIGCTSHQVFPQRLLEQIKNQSEAAELKTMTLTVEGSNGSKVRWFSLRLKVSYMFFFVGTAHTVVV